MGIEKLWTFPEDIKEGFVEKMSLILSLKDCFPGWHIGRIILGRQAISLLLSSLSSYSLSAGFCLHNLRYSLLKDTNPINCFSDYVFFMTVQLYFTLLSTISSSSLLYLFFFYFSFLTDACFWEITQFEVRKIEDCRETG